jgi:hypothetical protein
VVVGRVLEPLPNTEPSDGIFDILLTFGTEKALRSEEDGNLKRSANGVGGAEPEELERSFVNLSLPLSRTCLTFGYRPLSSIDLTAGAQAMMIAR